jgi:hypothetical protein
MRRGGRRLVQGLIAFRPLHQLADARRTQAHARGNGMKRQALLPERQERAAAAQLHRPAGGRRFREIRIAPGFGSGHAASSSAFFGLS